MRLLFPHLQVTFSAGFGREFQNKMLKQLCVSIVPSACFLFQGAPDILIHHSYTLVNSSNIDLDSSTSEDEAVENCHQRPPLKANDGVGLPEKTGEIFAALYILLVSKILRKIIKGKNIERKSEVKGLLVDKILSGVECSLSVEMRKGAASPLIAL